MLLSLQQALPQTWRDTFQLLASGFTWTLELSKPVLDFALFGSTPWERVFKAVLIVLPCFVLVVGMMCTMASLYTLPFRSGRGGFLVAVVMSWWDWLRMTWFYWAGLLRFVLVALGWIWGLLKLAGSLFLRFVKFIFTRPLALLDWATRQYFQPGVPWLAFIFIIFWSALEATIFTFTLRPTITEVLADLTGSELSGWGVSLILWPFLFILISGSFAAIQALSDAIKAKKTSQIVSMALVEGFVMFFEVMFLYRELIDAITPWISSQTGFQLGFFSTLTLASFGWVGVRAMTWFLRPVRHAGAARHSGAQEHRGRPRRCRGGRPDRARFLEGPDRRAQARGGVVQEGSTRGVRADVAASAAARRRDGELRGGRDPRPSHLHAAVPEPGPALGQHAPALAQWQARGPRERRMSARRGWRRIVLAAVAAAACGGGTEQQQPAKPANWTMVIGIDVSGSFRDAKLYDDAAEFAGYYLYAHLHGLGGLRVPTAVFVGPIGGARASEPKPFHPINDLQGRTVERIASDLRLWFPATDTYTDFNAFFNASRSS